MIRYVYVLEFNDSLSPHSMFGTHVMCSRDYNKIRSRCRKISRDKSYGACYIYRAEVDATEYEIAHAFCSGLVKYGERWHAGDIDFVYIGRYSHSRDTGCNFEFYSDWTLGRTSETRHSMSVITPTKGDE